MPGLSMMRCEGPVPVVNLLNDRKKGLVGLWTGNDSGGDFANLTIIPAA